MGLSGPQLVHSLRFEAGRAGFTLEEICGAARGLEIALIRSIERGNLIPSGDEGRALAKTFRRALGSLKRRAKKETPWQSARRGSGIFYDGRHFDSLLECAVYKDILLRQRAGELGAELQQQDTVYLSLARIKYIPDFRTTDLRGGSTKPIWIEGKGVAGERWPTIVKLWRWYGPGPLEVWTGSHERPCLDRKNIIIPKRSWAEISAEYAAAGAIGEIGDDG